MQDSDEESSSSGAAKKKKNKSKDKKAKKDKKEQKDKSKKNKRKRGNKGKNLRKAETQEDLDKEQSRKVQQEGKKAVFTLVVLSGLFATRLSNCIARLSAPSTGRSRMQPRRSTQKRSVLCPGPKTEYRTCLIRIILHTVAKE